MIDDVDLDFEVDSMEVLDIDIFAPQIDNDLEVSYEELDAIFDLDDSIEKAAIFSARSGKDNNLLLLESSEYDMDVFSDFVTETQQNALGLQKLKIIDASDLEGIGKGKEYSMFLTRLQKILGVINDVKKMNQVGSLLIDKLTETINSNVVRVLHDRPIPFGGIETFPNWLAKIFSSMYIEEEWDLEAVYEKVKEIFAIEGRRLSEDEKAQIRKELDILSKKTRLVIDQEKGRAIYNTPIVNNIACYFTKDSLICECGGRSDIQFDLDIVPLSALILTTQRNKKQFVVMANPPYLCRVCDSYICLPEIFVDSAEQAVKEIILDMKINFKGFAFYRPPLQDLLKRLPSDSVNYFKTDEDLVISPVNTGIIDKKSSMNSYVFLYLSLIKRFTQEKEFYIDYSDFEKFVASVVQTLETNSIFTLSYEIYVFEDDRRMSLEQTLEWLSNNLCYIAGIQYFTSRWTLSEVLPPVLTLLIKAYVVRYLVDQGNFKKLPECMKIQRREIKRKSVPPAVLWDYYSYMCALTPENMDNISIQDFYWTDQSIHLVNPMSHNFGYSEYKKLLNEGKYWLGFDSSYFDTSKKVIYAKLLDIMDKNSDKFLKEYVFPLPVKLSYPKLESEIDTRLLAAHKIATMIENGSEGYIGETCFHLQHTSTYSEILSQILLNSTFIGENTPLFTENRGLFDELNNNNV